MSIYKRFTQLLAALIIVWSAAANAVQPLEMTDVVVDQLPTTIEFTITGHNFMNGGDVELWLGGIPLDTLTQTDTVITAKLPDGMSSILEGSYQMLAMTGNGAVREDAFDGVTIGAQGLQGVPGIDGMDGDPGADGATGPTGPQGATGPDGPAGADGADGDDGMPGADGADGAPGTDGDDGAPGADGEDGAPGADGNNGAPGLNGATGMTGATGDTGDQGPQGAAGNLALAGMICPDGEFLRGFDASGNIICSSIIGDTEPPPPPPPPGETNPPGTLTIQPIAICRDDGTQCPTIELDQAGMIGFWQPTGITVVFLPALTLNDSTIFDINLNGTCNDMLTALGGSSDPAPLQLYVADCGGLAGGSWQGGNGIVMNDDFDHFPHVVNHIIGHNLDLFHVDDPLNLMFAIPPINPVITDGQTNIALGSALIE